MMKRVAAFCLACVAILFAVSSVLANNPAFDYDPYDFYDDNDGYGDFAGEIEDIIQTELEERIQIASVTVLMDAAKDGTSADIRKLIKDGEYIHAKDYEGNTALTYAIYNNTPEVVQALIDAGAYVSRNLLLDLSYASLEYPDVIGVLLKAGADITARDDDGNTVLMKAVYYRSHVPVSVISALIESGADVNAMNNNGKSALMYTAKNNNLEGLVALIRAGASVNSADKDGKTALMYAVEEGNTYIVNALLKLGADAKIKDNNGKTALDYAKRSSFTNDTLKRLGASWYQLNWW